MSTLDSPVGAGRMTGDTGPRRVAELLTALEEYRAARERLLEVVLGARRSTGTRSRSSRSISWPR